MSAGRRGSERCSTLFFPIFRDPQDSPNIAGFIERQAEQPLLFKLSEGNAVDHAGCYSQTRGQAIEMDERSGGDGTRRAYSASTKVRQNHLAAL